MDLLGGDEIRCALDPLLDRADGAALAEVDDLDASVLWIDDDIVGLHVRVHEPFGVDVLNGIGDHGEDPQRFRD